MVTPTMYKVGDRIRTTMAIGRNEVKIVENVSSAPQVIAPGSLGQIISENQGQLEAYLENKSTMKVVRCVIPINVRGKIEKFEHYKSWC